MRGPWSQASSRLKDPLPNPWGGHSEVTFSSPRAQERRRLRVAALALLLLLSFASIANAGDSHGSASGQFATWKGVSDQSGNPPGQPLPPRCATGREHDVNDTIETGGTPCITHSQSSVSQSG